MRRLGRLLISIPFAIRNAKLDDEDHDITIGCYKSSPRSNCKTFPPLSWLCVPLCLRIYIVNFRIAEYIWQKFSWLKFDCCSLVNTADFKLVSPKFWDATNIVFTYRNITEDFCLVLLSSSQLNLKIMLFNDIARFCESII